MAHCAVFKSQSHNSKSMLTPTPPPYSVSLLRFEGRASLPNAHRRYSFAIVTMEPSHAIARWDFFWALRIALDAGEGNRDKRRKITAGRQADWRSLIFIFKSKEKRKRKKERKGGKKEKEEHRPLCTVYWSGHNEEPAAGNDFFL